MSKVFFEEQFAKANWPWKKKGYNIILQKHKFSDTAHPLGRAALCDNLRLTKSADPGQQQGPVRGTEHEIDSTMTDGWIHG